MFPKIIFKIFSILSLAIFVLMIPVSAYVLADYSARLWAPDSSFTESLGSLQPIFSFVDVIFHEPPDFYSDRGFITLSFISDLTTMLFALLFFWLVYKLLKNIYKKSLFMYENVSLVIRLGIVIAVFGTASSYAESLMFSKVLSALEVTNAQMTNTNVYYIDMILSGLVLIFIGFALKVAVQAVEENEKTI